MVTVTVKAMVNLMMNIIVKPLILDNVDVTNADSNLDVILKSPESCGYLVKVVKVLSKDYRSCHRRSAMLPGS